MRIFSGFFVAAVVLASLAAEAQAGRRAYCDAYARDVANSRVSGGDVLAGTVGGAIGGAFLGAVIDGGEGAGKGAIIGGVGGTVVGAAAADSKWHRVYRKVLADCMDMYEPRPAVYKKVVYKKAVYKKQVAKPAEPLEPGSEAWNDYCAAKYNSFDRETGLYTGKSGKQRTCVVSP
jgi:uncharacterized protein YcfJ